jgi:hypothetical protein
MCGLEWVMALGGVYGRNPALGILCAQNEI